MHRMDVLFMAALVCPVDVLIEVAFVRANKGPPVPYSFKNFTGSTESATADFSGGLCTNKTGSPIGCGYEYGSAT